MRGHSPPETPWSGSPRAPSGSSAVPASSRRRKLTWQIIAWTLLVSLAVAIAALTSGLRDVIHAVPMASIEVHESRLYLFPGKKVKVSGYDEAVDRTLAVERASQTAAVRVEQAVPQTSDAGIEGPGS